MSISDQMARTAARVLRAGMQDSAGRALKLAQWGAARAVLGIETAEPRLTTLTEAGLRLTEVSARCVDQLVRQGLASARGALADGTARLRMTAQAPDLATFYNAQRAAVPKSRERVAQELEATWQIVSSTGRELAAIAQATREDLFTGPRGKRARRRRPPRAHKGTPTTRRRSAAHHPH